MVIVTSPILPSSGIQLQRFYSLLILRRSICKFVNSGLVQYIIYCLLSCVNKRVRIHSQLACERVEREMMYESHAFLTRPLTKAATKVLGG